MAQSLLQSSVIRAIGLIIAIMLVSTTLLSLRPSQAAIRTPTRTPTRTATRTPTRAPTSTPTPGIVITPTPSCETAVYTLFGRVYDASNPSQGIANAFIVTTTSIGSAPSTTSNADGSYSMPITNPYHGCHVLGLSVFANGYQTARLSASWQELMAQPQRDFALVRATAGTP